MAQTFRVIPNPRFSGRDSSHQHKLSPQSCTGGCRQQQSPGQPAQRFPEAQEPGLCSFPGGTRERSLGSLGWAVRRRRRAPRSSLLTHSSHWEFSSRDFSCDRAPRARSGSAPRWVKALQTSSHTLGMDLEGSASLPQQWAPTFPGLAVKGHFIPQPGKSQLSAPLDELLIPL